MHTAIKTTIAIVLASMACSADAISLPPGFSDSLTSFSSSTSNSFGDVVEHNDVVFFTGNFRNNALRANGAEATLFGSAMDNITLGITARDSFLYVGVEGGNVYRLDASVPAPTALLLGSSGTSSAMGLAFAPAVWGSFGGDLIVSGLGSIRAYDLGTSTWAQVFSSGTQHSAIAFTLDGQLLATSNGSTILRINPNGSSSVFAVVSGNGFDGLAVHPVTGEVYAADPNSRSIHKFAADGTSLGIFATDTGFDGGYYPSPLEFSQDGSKLYWASSLSPRMELHEIAGFPSAAGFDCGSLSSIVGNWGLSADGCGNFTSNATSARYESAVYEIAPPLARGAAPGEYSYEVEFVANRPRQPSASASVFVAGSPYPLRTATQNWDRAFAFNITRNGKYSIFRYDGPGLPIPLQKWVTPTGVVINQAPASNTLRVERLSVGAGHNLRFSINGVAVQELQDTLGVDQFGTGFVRSLPTSGNVVTDDWMEVLSVELSGLAPTRAGTAASLISRAQQQANDAANRSRGVDSPLFAPSSEKR